MTNKIDLSLVLSCPMIDNDANAKNVGEYLHSLLFTLWEEGEGFSGKRPFGNSGWEDELYIPLIVGEFVDGKLDEDGYIGYVDEKAANKLIFDCIAYVFKDYVGE